MKLDKYDIELIEKHIDGTLSNQESKDFLLREQESDEFREAVIFQRELLAMLEARQKSKLKKQLKKEFQQNKKIKSRLLTFVQKTRTWYGIAASVLLIAASFFIFRDQSINREEIYQQFFEPYPNILKSRSIAKDSIGMGFYSLGRYKDAINSLLHVPANDTINFYLGVCYMSIKDNRSAILYLNKIHEPSIFMAQKRWYLGLAQMESQLDSAINTLEGVKVSEFKYKESQIILNTIK